MEQNVEFAAGKLRASEGLVNHHQEWRELAIRLNEKGVKKTSRKWARCWIDWKCTVRRKYSKMTAYNLNPEGEPPNIKISDLEQRLIDLLNRMDAIAATRNHAEPDTDPLFNGEIIASQEVTTEDPKIKIEIDDTYNYFQDPDVEGQNGTNSYVKKKAATPKKACVEQLKVLLKYMEEDLEFASGKSRFSRGLVSYNRQWKELSLQLNSLGPEKTPKKWARCWVDWKNFAKNKHNIMTKKRHSSRVKYKSTFKVTSLERRLIKLMHQIDTTSEHECPFNEPPENVEDNSTELNKTGRKRSTTKLSAQLENPKYKSSQKLKLFQNGKKVCSNQLRILLEAMESSPNYMNGCTKTVKDKEEYCKWKQEYCDWLATLSVKLNSHGVRKTPWKWSRCWIDWKAATKKKYLRYPRNSPKGILTSLEMRLLNLMGEAKFTQELIDATALHDINKSRNIIDRAKECDDGSENDEAINDIAYCDTDDSTELYEDIISSRNEETNHRQNKEIERSDFSDDLKNVSLKQLRMLLEHIERNPSMNETSRSNDGRTVYTTLWKHLTAKLNACGKRKSCKNWIQCWLAWKNSTQRKEAIMGEYSDVEDGEVEVNKRLPLSLLERKLLKFIQERNQLQLNNSHSEESNNDPFDSDSDLPITQLINASNNVRHNVSIPRTEESIHNNFIRIKTDIEEDNISNVSVAESNLTEDSENQVVEEEKQDNYKFNMRLNRMIKEEVRRKLAEEGNGTYFLMRQKYREARKYVLKF